MNNERKLIDEIKKLINDDVIIGYFNGTTFTDDIGNTYTKLITNNSVIGRGFIVPYNNQWLVIIPNNNEEVRKNIIVKRRKIYEDPNKIVYPVITLIQSGLDGYTIPEGQHTYEYWLTGNPILKRIVADPALGFNEDNGFLQFDGGDAFLLNCGNGKYLAATSYFELPISYWEDDTNKGYYKQHFIIRDKINSTIELIPTFYGNFIYLGKGIYQSFIEDGIGQQLAVVSDGLDIIPNRMFIRNRETVYQYTNGFGRDFQIISSILQATKQLNANILPETKNITIINNLIVENTGTIDINLDGIYDFDLFVTFTGSSNPLTSPTLQLSKILASPYLKSTTSTPGSSAGYLVIYRDRPFFGWRSKTITHSVTLPETTSTFAYNSTTSKVGSDYIYTETMSGELLLASWDKKYIIHSFTDIEKVSTYNNTPEFTEVFTNYESQSLTLKTYGDTEGINDITLNSSGKFLILSKNYRQVGSDTLLTLELDTTAFRIKIIKSIDYLTINPDLDLTSYVNEDIITSDTIDNTDNYLIRGTITAVTEDSSDIWFTITINSKTKLPRIKTRNNFSLFFSDPFYSSIVLDNGCFWNYYLSWRSDNVDIESARISYIRFNYNGETFNNITPFPSSTINQLICDQNIRFVHTNPITYPFCSYQQIDAIFPPSNILKVDNLVGNSIFRVNEYTLLESSIENYTKQETTITKMPISEWKITTDGNIKYSKTFLVDYQIKRPYYNAEFNECDAQYIIPTTHSYYPA